jgi:Carboxypeptidase regulatory-like domain/TonB-dependent Receptor Plug Domain
MKRILGFSFLLVTSFLLGAAETGAQGLTGELVGTVKDIQGGVLVGAVVRVASPALIGGVLETTSSDKGQWRFPVLAPGTYALTVELPPKFSASREEGILVGAGASLDRSVVLNLTGVTQTITVEASSSVERGSGLATRFGADDINTIPTRRYSMFDLIRSAPGVSPTSPASGSVNTLSIFGSGVNENTFLIDGTNFTCPCQGVSRAEPILDVIQEVHVQTMGASVEYGNLQGGVINVVTKQGGARFMSDTSFYGQPSGLTAQPIVLPIKPPSTQTQSGYEREKYGDFTTSVGGPIKQDRAWFFAAYQHLRDYDSQPGTDPAFPRTYKQDKFFGKATWKVTPTLQVMSSFHQENWVNPTPATIAAPFDTTLRTNASVPSMTFADLTQVISSRTFWEARVGRFITRQHNDPSSGDFTTPSHTDQITGTASGNATVIGGPTIERTSAKAVLHRYQPAWLGGDHEFMTGLQVEQGKHQSITVFPGGVQYIDSSGSPFQIKSRAPAITGGEFLTEGLFASDSMTFRNRVTVDAGLRFDHGNASSPDLPTIDAEGNETGGVIHGLGTLFTTNVFSPRLGMTAKLSSDARTVLRASYGRFNQGVLTGELDSVHPGLTPITTKAYDPATGGYTKLVSVVDPTINLAIDSNMRTPRTDEYAIGVDRQIGQTWSASAAYVRKTGDDYIGWTDVGGQYQQQTRTLADGTVLPVLVLTSSTASRRFLLTNPGNLSMNYDGIVTTVTRRLANRWSASGSYTYSQTRGLQATSNAIASEAQFSTIARPAFLTFGQDPNDLTNAYGRLPNDRPNIFRTSGSVALGKGVLLAASFQYFSGRPWAATTQVSLPQGSQRIMLEPRGSERLPAQSLLDLRIAKSLRFGQAVTADLTLDVLNLLNDTAAEAIQSDNRFASTFGVATQFMDPRRVMLGVRLNLGR